MLRYVKLSVKCLGLVHEADLE
jgi:galacturan 1,4-alpha-galacturonidase